MAEPVDWILAAAALCATAAVVVPRTSAPHARIVQVMGFLVLGVVVSLIWLRLDSVDVSLAEAALGGGLLGGALVYVASSARHHAPNSAHVGWLTPLLGTVAGAVLVISLASVWLRVEQTMPGWAAPLQDQLPGTGVDHGVTGVLLAFRAYDTLLESAILMLAALAALSLRAEHRPQSVEATAPGWMVRLMAPVLLLAGLWLLFAGSSDSGGAFQSGAVFAALLILMRVSGVGARIPDRGPRWVLSITLVAGVVVFILAGLLGPLLGQVWLSWDPSWAFTAVLTVEVLLTAGIAAGLYALYLALEEPA